MSGGRELSALLMGLAAALPVSLFPLFSPLELEDLICGAPEIDVNLLKVWGPGPVLKPFTFEAPSETTSKVSFVMKLILL